MKDDEATIKIKEGVMEYTLNEKSFAFLSLVKTHSANRVIFNLIQPDGSIQVVPCKWSEALGHYQEVNLTNLPE